MDDLEVRAALDAARERISILSERTKRAEAEESEFSSSKLDEDSADKPRRSMQLTESSLSRVGRIPTRW